MPSVRLEPLSERHLAHMAEIVKDNDVLRFTRVPDPTPQGWVREWYARYEAGRVDGTREAFAGVDEEGQFVGLCAGTAYRP